MASGQAFSWGLGYGELLVPHYHGSGEYYYLKGPFPIFQGIGKMIPGNRGKRAFYFDADANFRLPVNSEPITIVEPSNYSDPDERITGYKNYTRRGMADVPTSFYLGAKLGVNFAPGTYLEYGVTPGVHLGSGWGHAGVISTLKLNIEFFRSAEAEFSISARHISTNAAYNDIYYSVTAEDVISGRAIYDGAKSGKLVNIFGVFYRTNFGPLFLLAALEYQDLNGAVVEDSPLVRTTKEYFAAMGIGVYF